MNQKERIIQYVLHTPCNNNRQILESLLSDIDLQPDWSQNDETKKDYIKNRPFYEGVNIENLGTTFEDWRASCQSHGEDSMVINANVAGIDYQDVEGLVQTDTNGRYVHYYFGENRDYRIEVDRGMAQVTIRPAGTEYYFYKVSSTVKQIDPKYIKDMYYSEITEVVVGTGANNGWFATVKPDGTIPKLRINGTIYENVQKINTGGNPTYQVGKYQISISPNAGTWTIIPNDISANDLEFLGIGTVYHPVPDEYIPEWVANKSNVAQSDWNETDRNSPAFIFNKPSVPVEILYDPNSSTKYSLKSGLNIVCISRTAVSSSLEQFPQISANRIITTTGVIRSIKTGKLMTQSEYPYGCAAFWYIAGAKSIAYCLNPLDPPSEQA